MAYRKKNFFDNHFNKRKHNYRLQPGDAGFLCTCNSKLRERDCVRESYNLLTEFADELFGPEFTDVKKTTTTEASEDIDAALAEEVKALKAENNRNVFARRFQVVESGVNGAVFIKTTVTDPVTLAHKVALHVAETKQQKSKFLTRLVPVEVTCKANIDEICRACTPLIEKYFKSEPKTFAVVFAHRLNDSVNRNELTEKLAALVGQQNEAHKADLKHAQLSVVVEVIRGLCCISVVPDYQTLKKYNLLELAGLSASNKPKDEGTKDTEGVGHVIEDNTSPEAVVTTSNPESNHEDTNS